MARGDDIFAKAERLMGMDDAVWRRHANPWSGLTRFTILPLFAVAVWSRQWLGWGALVPVVLVIAWTWFNPRAFPPPSDYGHWVSRAVLGERIYLERANRALDPAHLRAARTLTGLSATGLAPFVYGLWVYDLATTVLGIVLMAGAKAWFCDRMVWLHVDETKIPLGAAMPQPTWEQKK